MNDLEIRVNAIEERLARLERLAGMAPHYSEAASARMAPPVPNPTPAFVLPPRTTPPPFVPQPPSPSAAPRAARTTEQTEYQIGAKLLPIVGAVAILTAIGFLVSLGLQRGWITPAMLFGAVCVACVGFIGVGLWKRNEKEEFGQILTGIGSCGLYLNFAAGHVYQHLYEGEALVALFVGLSMLNLVYAGWRASKPFLAIGLLGGLSAAMMPLHDGKVALDVVLQFLILLPAAWIAARNRWVGLAMAMFAVATLALVPAMLMAKGLSVDVVAAGLLGTALIPVVAYGWAERKVEWDPRGTFAPSALIANSVLCLAMRCDPRMSANLVGASVLAAIAAWALGARYARNSILIGAAAVAFFNAPYGLRMEQSTWAYIALAALAAAISRRVVPKAASLFAGCEYVAAAWCYLQLAGAGTFPATRETAILVAMMALTVWVAYAISRVSDSKEQVALAAMVLLGPLLIRLSYHAVFLPEAYRRDYFVSIGGLVTYAALLCAVALVTRWKSAVVLGWIALGLTLYVYAGAIAIRTDTAAAAGVAIELCSAAIAVGLVASSSRYLGDADRITLASAAVCLFGAFATRFGYLALHSAGVAASPACFVAAMGAALVAGVLARSTRIPGVPWGSAVLWALVAASYWLASMSGETLGVLDPWIVTGLLAGLVLTCLAIQRIREENAMYWLAALLSWPLVSHLGWILLGPKGLGMNDNASVTAAWIALALTLLTLGFAREKMHLRLSSLMVIGATIFKVALVDLANTDQVIKALILILLGALTLGGGYWYIHTKGRTLGAGQ